MEKVGKRSKKGRREGGGPPFCTKAATMGWDFVGPNEQAPFFSSSDVLGGGWVAYPRKEKRLGYRRNRSSAGSLSHTAS